jgi:hypothetical protein
MPTKDCPPITVMWANCEQKSTSQREKVLLIKDKNDGTSEI